MTIFLKKLWHSLEFFLYFFPLTSEVIFATVGGGVLLPRPGEKLPSPSSPTDPPPTSVIVCYSIWHRKLGVLHQQLVAQLTSEDSLRSSSEGGNKIGLVVLLATLPPPTPVLPKKVDIISPRLVVLHPLPIVVENIFARGDDSSPCNDGKSLAEIRRPNPTIPYFYLLQVNCGFRKLLEDGGGGR